MSLINQMLKDLEQRKVAPGKTQPISGEVRAVSMAREFRPTPLLLMLVGVLIVGAVAWVYLGRHKPAPVAQLPQPVPVPLPAHNAALSAVPVVPQAKAEVVDSTPVPMLDSSVGAPKEDFAKPVERPRHPHGLGLKLSPTLMDASHQSLVRNSKEKLAKSSRNSHPAPAAIDTEVESQLPDLPSKSKPLSKMTEMSSVAPAKTMSTTQQSDNLYRQSVSLLQQGRVAEAQDSLRKSLEANSRNLKARQALVGLMFESKHADDASQLLKDGLKLSPEQSGFSMALARLQVESGDSKSARDTLEAGLSYAGEDADYHAFYAAILQRDEQHEAAVQHYLTALQVNPAMPTWLVGIGISLQAQGKLNDATAAYQRARDTGQLTPQLMQFVELRLKQIKSAH